MVLIEDVDVRLKDLQRQSCKGTVVRSTGWFLHARVLELPLHILCLHSYGALGFSSLCDPACVVPRASRSVPLRGATEARKGRRDAEYVATAQQLGTRFGPELLIWARLGAGGRGAVGCRPRGQGRQQDVAPGGRGGSRMSPRQDVDVASPGCGGRPAGIAPLPPRQL